MKLNKFLLFGLLGICVPLTMATSCSDKPEPDDPEVVPHHPTSNFDQCPLLAHIDNPKLGIKEITVERYLFDKLYTTSVYSYDKEQRIVKATGINEDGAQWEEECSYDAMGRIIKSVVTNDQEASEMTAFIYDEYGFLVKMINSYSYKGEEDEYEENYSYVGDTLIVTYDDRKQIWVYSDDMYPIYYLNSNGAESIWEWKDGNVILYKNRWSSDGEWDESRYEYDANVNIEHLTEEFFYIWFDAENMGKNNRLDYKAFTYTDKGMVTTKQSADGSMSYKYTYLYY